MASSTRSPLIDLRINLPDRLKSLRIQYGVNQQEMAKKLNVSTSTYSAWERGFRYPRIDEVNRIAAILGLTASGLLGTRFNEEAFAEQPLIQQTGDFILTKSECFTKAKNFEDVMRSAQKVSLPWLNLPSLQTHFVFKAFDSSMSTVNGDSIPLNALAIVNKHFKLEQLSSGGNIFLISIDRGPAMIREVGLSKQDAQDATISLIPWNKDFAVKTVPQNSVQVWGTVEYAIKTFI